VKSRYQTTCTNCNAPLPKQFVFQGVVICEKCHKIVSHLVQRARKELEMFFLTYTDMLRVALLKGEMNFPVLPKTKRMPGNEMQRAIYEMLSKMGAGDEAERSAPNSEGALPELQGDQTRADGEVPTGGHLAAVPGWGELREMPAMQEERPRGDRDPEGGADPACGVEGDTR